jgi:hypothetical protein
MSLLRLGPLRPALGFGGYRTPVPGFFITGAGTHPGASVSGIPGQQAARTLLKTFAAGDVPAAPPPARGEAPAPVVPSSRLPRSAARP